LSSPNYRSLCRECALRLAKGGGGKKGNSLWDSSHGRLLRSPQKAQRENEPATTLQDREGGSKKRMKSRETEKETALMKKFRSWRPRCPGRAKSKIDVSTKVNVLKNKGRRQRGDGPWGLRKMNKKRPPLRPRGRQSARPKLRNWETTRKSGNEHASSKKTEISREQKQNDEKRRY